MNKPNGIKKVLKKPANWRWYCGADMGDDFQARIDICGGFGDGLGR